VRQRRYVLPLRCPRHHRVSTPCSTASSATTTPPGVCAGRPRSKNIGDQRAHHGHHPQ
jgi:hypothetical protein